MLTKIRSLKKSIGGTIVAGFVVMLMMSFGLNSRGAFQQQQASTVIRVNKHEISGEKFSRELETMNNLYRDQFGANFAQIKSFLNLEQRTIDTIIEDKVASDFLKSTGISAGTAQVEAFIASSPYFAQAGLTRDSYERFLRAKGISGEELEEKTRQNLAERQLQAILSDLSTPSEMELKAVDIEQNTHYEFNYAGFKIEDAKKKVNLSDEAKLKEFYTSHAEQFRKPRSFSYAYVKFEPSEFMSKVPVAEDDIRERYNQKQSQFYDPKQLWLRQIVINKEKDSVSSVEEMVSGKKDPAKPDLNAARKAAAKDIVERLKKGEDFQELAKQLSEDKESAAKGGDMGWKVVTEIDKEVRAIADRVEKEKYSDVIELPTKFVIVYVQDIKERKLRPYEEMRAQLENELRSADAPEYARVEAESFLQRWHDAASEKLSLAEFAAKEKRTAKESGGLLSKTEDPKGEKGLTAKLAGLSAGERQAVKLGIFDYVVEVKETKDAYIPKFEEIQDAVKAEFVKSDAVNIARADAEKALAALQGTVPKEPADKKADSVQPAVKKSFEEMVKEYSVEARVTPDVTRANVGSDPLLAQPEAKRIGFTLTDESPTPKKVIQSADGFYVLQLKSRKVPDEKLVDDSLKTALNQEHTALTTRITGFVSQSLRASADVWVSPTLLKDSAAPGTPEPFDTEG